MKDAHSMDIKYEILKHWVGKTLEDGKVVIELKRSVSINGHHYCGFETCIGWDGNYPGIHYIHIVSPELATELITLSKRS